MKPTLVTLISTLMVLFPFASFSETDGKVSRIQGAYSVPTPVHLKPYAFFPVEYQLSEQDGKKTIQYDLPEDLLGGRKVTIRLTEDGLDKDGRVHFGGHHSGAMCSMETVMHCDVGYRNFGISQDEITDYITQKYESFPSLAAGILNVALMFSGEPAGVIELELPGPLDSR